MGRSRVALDVEIPSDVRYIEGVVELAAKRCRELDIPDKKCSLNIRVALTEALSNAILRGNGSSQDKIVRIRATVSDDAIVFDVVDQGPGFDFALEQRRDPTTPENLLSEEGRGIFLMRKLMDQVERIDDGGNTVRLTLKRQ
jgi:serine/threonine-protein kinase RsbW